MVELNYQELIDSYYQNLNDTLRNFKGGPGFLESWVYDENPNRSLLEILDLAAANGITRLEINLPEKIVPEVDMKKLSLEIQEMGTLSLIPNTMGHKLIFQLLNG